MDKLLSKLPENFFRSQHMPKAFAHSEPAPARRRFEWSGTGRPRPEADSEQLTYPRGSVACLGWLNPKASRRVPIQRAQPGDLIRMGKSVKGFSAGMKGNEAKVCVVVWKVGRSSRTVCVCLYGLGLPLTRFFGEICPIKGNALTHCTPLVIFIVACS